MTYLSVLTHGINKDFSPVVEMHDLMFCVKYTSFPPSFIIFQFPPTMRYKCHGITDNTLLRTCSLFQFFDRVIPMHIIMGSGRFIFCCNLLLPGSKITNQLNGYSINRLSILFPHRNIITSRV